MTAKEAFEKTKEVYITRIESFIDQAVKAGKFQCEILPSDIIVSEEHKQILKERGFEVTEKDSMLGKEIIISWQNA